jgi:hypothetical protein
MKVVRIIFTYCLVFSVMAGFMLSCGKKGPTYEQRIQALQDKGAPDSILSNVKVYLSNVRTLTRTGQAGKYKDSLKTGMAAAEA